MKKLLVIIYLFLLPISGKSQTDFFRIGLNIGFDYGVQLSKFSTEAPFDILDVNQANKLGAHLKADIYINKNWGTYLKAQTVLGINNYSKAKLSRYLESYYGDDYYVKDIKSVSSPREDFPQTAFISVGGTYRLIDNKWSYQFGLGLGIAIFNSPEYSYYIKERGSNQYYEIELKANIENKFNFLFEPSIKVSYDISNRLGIFISGLYTALPAGRVSFYNSETNLYTKNEVQIKESFNKWYQLAQLNLGLTIGIGRVK